MADIDRPDPGDEVASSWGIQVADRVVARYASEAARDAATPTQEGQVAYVIDIDELQVFDGTVWDAVLKPVAGSVDIANNTLINIGVAGGGSSLGGAGGSVDFIGPGGGFVWYAGSDDSFRVRGGNAFDRLQILPGVEFKLFNEIDGSEMARISHERAILGGLVVGSSPHIEYRTPALGVSGPTYSFHSDTDTGIYRDSENSVSVASGGSQAARFSMGAWFYFAPSTTGSNANMHRNGTDSRIRDSTSTLADKTGVKPISNPKASAFIKGLKPISFRHKGDHDRDKDDGDPGSSYYWGFGAEDVAGLLPEAAEIRNYDHRAILAALTKVVQGLM